MGENRLEWPGRVSGSTGDCEPALSLPGMKGGKKFL
jgi:hypothetical protein